MTDIIERLTEYNKDWRTRAGSAKEVTEAIDEIKRLRAALVQFVAVCDTAPPLSLMKEIGMALAVACAALSSTECGEGK